MHKVIHEKIYIHERKSDQHVKVRQYWRRIIMLVNVRIQLKGMRREFHFESKTFF